ncbi:siderophore-interacting protein [Nocardioides hwasunensis]|uniref:Siderophore-interacting protein n=1 Tax=Nocardioides hwasunensis TaxID=397258 RepID=A0ABR8MJC4_9ACTN|nr:siderophore-interacting protein [Nocardioides hwasunensis]MBD3916145.1 siderophore-interacting protein [Nocardioides hwasunensis]
MSTRAAQFQATVRRRESLSDHLVRLVLDGLDGFASTGISDEWVGLVVPGQFQSRYYTVRAFSGGELTLDVVVHDVGLVTEWAMRDCVGDTVTITEPKASFLPPVGATWLLLVGDLTAMPAMARIVEEHPDLTTYVMAEVPDQDVRVLSGYLPDTANITWLSPPAPGQSALAQVVEGIDWPEGEGYFWMAGESAQMRAIRKHLMRGVGLPTSHYDVMGYWRATAARQPRAVDPGPIWRAGKAAGKSDEQIWADYDAAREASDD